jgi:response regulator RpfG family c-di-GMP phosphodiesterase
LIASGFNIISYDNPVKALEYFYENTNNCSVVITDYRMPEMSGLEFLKKIREKDTALKIKTIIVSAYTKTDIPYEISYIMKIDKILEKPVFLDELKTEIQKLIVTN